MRGHSVPQTTATPKRKVSRLKAAGKLHVVKPSKEDGANLIGTPMEKVIFHLPPGELTVHPDLLEVAAPSTEEKAQLAEAIREQGILHPLIANSAKQVLDGARRLAEALAQNLPTVPVIFDDRVDAVAVALSTALSRRHLSQGQRALYIFKLHRDLNGVRSVDQPEPDLSFRELERRYGLADTLFVNLNTMRKGSSAEEWAAIVGKIESGASSLTQEYKGFAGRAVTKDQPRPPARIDKQAARSLVAIKTFSKHWDHLSLEEQTNFVLRLVKTVAGNSPDMAAVIEKAFGQVRIAKGQQPQ